jgi:hypothetical protein
VSHGGNIQRLFGAHGRKPKVGSLERALACPKTAVNPLRRHPLHDSISLLLATFATCRDVRGSVAIGGIAEMMGLTVHFGSD